MRNVCRRTIAVVLCVLGAAHVVSTSSVDRSLTDKEPHRQHLDPVEHRQKNGALGVQRRTRSAAVEQFLSLISEITRIGAENEQPSSVNRFGRSSNIILPSPIKLDGNNVLQLVFIPTPVGTSEYNPSVQIPNIQLLANIPPSVSTLKVDQNVLVSDINALSYQTPEVSIQPPISHKDDQTIPYSITKPKIEKVQINVDSYEELPLEGYPTLFPVESSKKLLKLFRAQKPKHPWLPAIVIGIPKNDNITVESVKRPSQNPQFSSPQTFSKNNKDTEEPCFNCKGSSNFGSTPDNTKYETPALPRFERSMMIQAVLTVFSSDFSEPYTLWWDAINGASRIEHHGGTSSSYRSILPDGRMKSVHVRLDRTGDMDVRRCILSEPREIKPAERALPVLPDISKFSFVGYIDVTPAPSSLSVRVERWVYTVRSSPGESGAVDKEILTYRHELIVARSSNGLDTTPLRYAVVVDSSMLGKKSESYVHRFLKVYTRYNEPTIFDFDSVDGCDTVDITNKTEIVEPLREFSLPERDPKYDDIHARYKKSYDRQYADEFEESVRKTTLIQKSRFIESGNRKGATFELATNGLSDRLQDEIEEEYYGISDSANENGDPFPHSKEQIQRLSGTLPQAFDWRQHGAVTKVRDQKGCAACWAFTVVGAVEGALFVKTSRLVPLSEQCLLDCSGRYSTSGCKPSRPGYALNYVRMHGLSALEEYPYTAKAYDCKPVNPVTHISGYVNVTTLDTAALKIAIRKHGPTIVLLKVTETLHSYKKGAYYDEKCNKGMMKHAMLAVGWIMFRGDTYFILKNSWGTKWGYKGFIYMHGSSNMCAILESPIYPVLRRKNVDRVPGLSRAGILPKAK